jgi:uncharacterized protein (DUF302 family)
MTQFGNDVEVSDTCDRTVARTRVSLADHGFGILTEIDVAATMKAKLNQDMPAYLILGARNPYLAHTALGIDPSIGLLLPCNVVVGGLESHRTLVEALDPVVMVTATGNPSFADVAADAATLLAAVLSEPGTPDHHSTPTLQ